MECGSRYWGRTRCVGGVQGRLQVEQELAVQGVVGAEAREAVRDQAEGHCKQGHWFHSS